MERSCEFCGVPRPVVYCQSDAAFLCLSCDTKVHSANALSGRHYRDLLCDSCRDNTAFVRCLNHSMLLCRGCESHLHDVFSDHKTLMLKSFTGCPSAHHFASLLGFNVSEQAQFFAAGVQVASESRVSSERDNVKLKSSGPAKPEKGRSSKRHQEQNNHHKKQNNSLVVQQILNLKKLQVAESEKQSSAPFTSSGNADSGSNQPLKEQNYFNRNLRTFDNPSHASENEDYPLPISELDHLSNSQVFELLLHLLSYLVVLQNLIISTMQFWSQNLQDLGVCEDLGHFDDFNIPDVDISFRNFEELFASEVDVPRPLLKDSDLMWSQVAKTALVDDSGTSRAKTTEDVSVASSISFNNDITSEDKTQRSDNVALRTFGDMETLSRSFLSAESSDSDCLDSGHSEKFTETEAVDSSRKISLERKKSQWHGKRSKLGRNNDESNRRQRINGGFVNVQGHESSSLNVTKS